MKLTLKKGMSVILVKNLDNRHVNGSRGTVVGFTAGTQELDDDQKPSPPVPIVHFTGL